MLVLAAAGAVLLALSVRPRSCGYGTHEQLNLPTCSSLAATGYPCPTCGLTTSLAAMVRGRMAAAWRAHPFGPILFGAIAAMGVAGLVEMSTGRNVLRRLRPGVWWAVVGVLGLLTGWSWKLAAGITRGELPIH